MRAVLPCEQVTRFLCGYAVVWVCGCEAMYLRGYSTTVIQVYKSTGAKGIVSVIVL
jgi:hypothetical protein